MNIHHNVVQETSYSESISTLAFGERVSQITLGAAKKNTESAAMMDAREATGRMQRALEAATSRADMYEIQ